MSALDFAFTLLKNFNPTASVKAGGAASMLIYAIGLGLVTANVALPVIGVPTMAMVGGAAVVIGHIVTSLVPDSFNQQVNAMASKLNVSVDDLKASLPDVQASYPGDTKPSDTVTNLKLKS